MRRETRPLTVQIQGLQLLLLQEKGTLSFSMLRARNSKTPEQAHRVDADSPVDEYPLYTVCTNAAKPLMVDVNLNGVSTDGGRHGHFCLYCVRGVLSATPRKGCYSTSDHGEVVHVIQESPYQSLEPPTCK